jgi:5-oxoprolinase (ATP-hydrolysing)
MLGKIQPAFFPRVFGPEGDQPLDADIVRAQFAALAEKISAAIGSPRTPEQIAEGFIQIAVSGVVRAIKQISVARGHDVTAYTLAVFGGAGGQHACLVADALGMTRVFAHPLAGVLSAYGMGLADQTATREAARELTLDVEAIPLMHARLDALASEARAELRAQGVPDHDIEVRRSAHLRYQGTDTSLVVDAGDSDDMRAAFEETYRLRFAFLMASRPLIIEAVSVEAIAQGAQAREAIPSLAPRPWPLRAADTVRTFSWGGWRDTPIIDGGTPDRGMPSSVRRSSPKRTRPPWSSRAGAPR